MNQSLPIKLVALKTLPDAQLFVRTLSAIDELDLRDVIRKEEDTRRIVAAQLVAYVCNADRTPRFATIDDAIAFMGEVVGTVPGRLIQQATKFNELSEEALEEAEKN